MAMSLSVAFLLSPKPGALIAQILVLLSPISFTETSFTSKQMFWFLLLNSSVGLSSLALACKSLLVSFLLQLIQLLGLLRVSDTRLRPRLSRLTSVRILPSPHPLGRPHLAGTAGAVKVCVGIVDLQVSDAQLFKLRLQPRYAASSLLGHRLSVQHRLPGVVQELVGLHYGLLVSDLGGEFLDLSVVFILLRLLGVIEPGSLPSLLFLLQGFQLLHNVGINKVSNVVTLPGLGDYIILLILWEIVVLLQVNDVVVSHLQLQLPLSFPPGNGGLHFFLFVLHPLFLLLQPLLQSSWRNESRPGLVVTGLGRGHRQLVHDGLHLLALVLEVHSMLQQHLAGPSLDVHDTVLSDSTHVHYLQLRLLLNGCQHSLLVRRNLRPLQDVRLVGHHQEGLVGK